MVNLNQIYSEELLQPGEALSSDIMTIAVEAVKEKLKKKGIVFNCPVIETMDDRNELLDFLRYLRNVIDNCAPWTRFQTLILCGVHWMALDIEIGIDQPRFLFIESAITLKVFLYLMLNIQKIFPQALIIYFESRMQKDRKKCGYFALDFAITLAKIPDLNRYLPKIVDIDPPPGYHSFCSYVQARLDENLPTYLNYSDALSGASRVVYCSGESFPLHFGSLFKNIQSLKCLPSQKAVNYLLSSGQSLKDYVMAHRAKFEWVVCDENPFAQAQLLRELLGKLDGILLFQDQFIHFINGNSDKHCHFITHNFIAANAPAFELIQASFVISGLKRRMPTVDEHELVLSNVDQLRASPHFACAIQFKRDKIHALSLAWLKSATNLERTLDMRTSLYFLIAIRHFSLTLGDRSRFFLGYPQLDMDRLEEIRKQAPINPGYAQEVYQLLQSLHNRYTLLSNKPHDKAGKKANLVKRSIDDFEGKQCLGKFYLDNLLIQLERHPDFRAYRWFSRKAAQKKQVATDIFDCTGNVAIKYLQNKYR